MSPQWGLWGFFLSTNLRGGSLLSRSQSFSRYCCLASVRDTNLCFTSLSLGVVGGGVNGGGGGEVEGGGSGEQGERGGGNGEGTG